MSEHMKYEYLFYSKKKFSQETLNAIGEKGWKLVTVKINGDYFGYSDYYFMKEL